MPALDTIPLDKLVRLVGLRDRPSIIDLQTDEDFKLDQRLIPGAVRRPRCGKPVVVGAARAVVVCQEGLKLSLDGAAWLRHEGVPPESLDGDALGWAAAGLPIVRKLSCPRGMRWIESRLIAVTRLRPTRQCFDGP